VKRWAWYAFVVVACSSSARTPSSRDTGSTGASIDPAVRVRGSVDGTIGPDKTSYSVGEPIFVTLEARNTGTAPLQFDAGADWGEALVHMRYRWIVRRSGKVLCDHGRDPSDVAGPVRVVELAPGETFRDVQMINAVCDALLVPGRYQLTVVRPFTHALRGCDVMAPPDTTRLAPGKSDPHHRLSEDCMTAMFAAPAIAADFQIEIAPWHHAALVSRIEAMPGQRAEAANSEDGTRDAMSDYGEWFCSRVRCDCSDDVRFRRVDDWFERALAQVPEVLPPGCPAR
jgi:hypothetical protein